MDVLPDRGFTQGLPTSIFVVPTGVNQGTFFRASWPTCCYEGSKRDRFVLLQLFGLHEGVQGGTAYEEKQVSETEYESALATQSIVFHIHIYLKLKHQEHIHSVPLIYGL